MGFQPSALRLLRLCQIDRRDPLSLCVLKCARCASPVVLDIGNEQVGFVKHPFVPANNGILRRYAFQRRIDNLIYDKLTPNYHLVKINKPRSGIDTFCECLLFGD